MFSCTENQAALEHKLNSKRSREIKNATLIRVSAQVVERAERLPDSLLVDVLHGEGGVLLQLLGLLLRLAARQDAVHGHRHQLDLDLIVGGGVVLRCGKRKLKINTYKRLNENRNMVEGWSPEQLKPLTESRR